MVTRLNPVRALGATGVKVPLIAYGTAPLGFKKPSRQEAVRCLNYAIDRGITYLDTSCDYGSEEHIGEVMRTRRSEVFLATKVNKRSRAAALAELKQSLARLQTDHVDLIQVHAVNAWADVAQILAPDGVVAALEEARSQGLTRFIGITGHARPEILAEAIRRYHFDTVLVALGVVDRLVSAPEKLLLPLAQERQMGVIAMKVLGQGALADRTRAVRYSLGLPGVSLAAIGLDNTAQIDEIVGIAAAYEPLDDAGLGCLIEEVRPLVEKDAGDSHKGKSKFFWLHDTAVLGWQEKDEPVIVQY